ncbi:hypothetical protein NX059_010521 [Plenodomus lindquistii]|nr:hypothetical protein NX059_010521 [Plenodomus lindquistii]
MDKAPLAKVTDPATRAIRNAEPIGIDFGEVECYIGELAEHNMNGREIRNAITTARRLAKFKKEQMDYSHLQHVIAVSSKFDKYLQSLQEGLTDNQIQRDDGVR